MTSKIASFESYSEHQLNPLPMDLDETVSPSHKMISMTNKRPSFKPYRQHQLNLLPIDLDELIPPSHMVRVIDRAIEKMNLTPLLSRYEGGGAPAYNPEMMLKVIVYAYADKTYSSCRIAKATRENINFMWLTGSTPIDFMTINRFRSERLQGIIEDIFTEVVHLLIAEKYIDFENYFLDGTKIEANANKNSYVWKTNTKRYMDNLREEVLAHLKEIDIIEAGENAELGNADLPETGNGKEINSAAIEEYAKKIDERLTENPESKPLKEAKKAIEKDYLPRMEKYEKQLEILGDRNSYSKTDPDATFMRMKEEDVLKAGYNVQIGTEEQFITGYSIHQKPGDTTTLIGHIDNLKEQMEGRVPKSVIADAGYGSEENYEYLESEHITSYVKYNIFHKETSSEWKNDPTKAQNFQYEETTDTYTCTVGRILEFKREMEEKTENGHTSRMREYECKDCGGCEHRPKCVKSEKESSNRRIKVNPRLNELRSRARELLNSEIGVLMRSKRSIEVESVFGDIKGNYGVRRFLLRGLEKVMIEWGLYAIGHNMRKMAAIMS